MKKKEISKPLVDKSDDNNKDDVKGYPIYPAKDDIYNKAHEEKEVDPESLDKIKIDNDELADDDVRELGLDDVNYGSDLDVPGSELDDEGEDMGNEDEENNYYSIGGDNHHDLEEKNDDDF